MCGESSDRVAETTLSQSLTQAESKTPLLTVTEE
jgi:hypothetical protein